MRLLDRTSIDLLDVSGGTYFPGAEPASEGAPSSGPYFLDFAGQARAITTIPVVATGGFRTRDQAIDAVNEGFVDAVSLARAMALNPMLANTWLNGDGGELEFPVFAVPPPGGVTAWYSMRLTALGEDKEIRFDMTPASALEAYDARDERRSEIWRHRFPQSPHAG